MIMHVWILFGLGHGPKLRLLWKLYQWLRDEVEKCIAFTRRLCRKLMLNKVHMPSLCTVEV